MSLTNEEQQKQGSLAKVKLAVDTVFSATIRIYIGSYSSCFGIQPLDF